ncbi:MAG: VCBS repeat-containing protein, partial [bacterium]
MRNQKMTRKAIFVILIFLPFLSYGGEWQEYFQDGSLTNTTLSPIPGVKHKKTHRASIKLSPQYPRFQKRPWVPSPQDILPGGTRPEFGDIDNDGDFDLLVSSPVNGTVSVFENRGTRYNPIFTKKKDIYFDMNEGYITLGDIDKDGLLDIFITLYKSLQSGTKTYDILGYKAIEPFAWQRYSSWDIKDIKVINAWYSPSPELGDLDNDGDPDLILQCLRWGTTTSNTEDFLAYENQDCVFIRKPELDLPTHNFGAGKGANPGGDIVDINCDNTPDFVFVDNEMGYSSWYSNTGTPSPMWLLRGLYFIGCEGDYVVASIGLADLDGDSDSDMFIGGDGIMIAFENIPEKANPHYPHPTYLEDKQKPYLVGGHIMSGVSFADFNSDGSYDEIYAEGYTSCGGTYLNMWKNMGSPENPDILASHPYYGLGGINLNKLPEYTPQTHPTVADLDNDGRIDILTSEYHDIGGRCIGAFRNISTQTSSLSFEQKKTWDITGAYLVLTGLDDLETMDPCPFALDLDNDRDYDVILLTSYRFLIIENTGTKESPTWKRNKVWEEEIDYRAIGYGTDTFGFWKNIGHIFPTAMDLDGDNLEDLVVIGKSGLHIYKRLGTLTSPWFQRMPEWEDNLKPLVRCSIHMPCGVDIDNDGDYDLAIAYKDSGPLMLINNSFHHPLGTYTSSIFDAGSSVIFENIFWKERKPFSTELSMYVRSGNSTSTLSSWKKVSNGESLNLNA